jgi:hypothetical protein
MSTVVQSTPTSLFCSDCGRTWADVSAPRWRASLSDDGSGLIIYTCAVCIERRQPLFSLQLEYVDGRWDVAETRLPTAPQTGDVIHVRGDEPWTVCGTRNVAVRPPGKPPRQFYVCRPALAA